MSRLEGTRVYPCSLCGTVEHDDIASCASACVGCGLVRRYFSDEPEPVPDGWQERAKHLEGPAPVSASRCPSVEWLAEALSKGPVYVETPNTREPTLSLRHFFRDRHPVYYEPQTLAIAAIMAGAEDISIDEVAGHVCALIVPGGTRKTYEEAAAQLGLPPLTGVAERMRHYFDPVPPEVMGEPLPGSCFLCGGQRRAWRSVAICERCSALTTVDQSADLLGELAEVFKKNPHPDPWVAPDLRGLKPDKVERIVLARKVVLGPATWACALLMSGADMARHSEESGALLVEGRALGPPIRRSFTDAKALLIKVPFYEGRHTLALMSQGPARHSMFDRWLQGEDVEDMEAMREEARLAVHTANQAMSMLDTICSKTGTEACPDDDWHRDPYLNGMRMGYAGAMSQIHWMSANAYAAIAGRVMK